MEIYIKQLMDRITKKYGTKSEMSHILSYDPAFEMSSSSSSFSSSFSSTVMTLAVSSLVINVLHEKR